MMTTGNITRQISENHKRDNSFLGMTQFTINFDDMTLL